MESNGPRGAQFQPPDGGWGWVIVMANSLGNISIIPILQNFGLIFKDRLRSLNMTGTDIGLLINTNASFGMLMGLVNGSLLKKYGYRKISVLGGILTSVGVILTAFANTFYQFLFSYGILTSLGFGMAIAALSLAVNTYFKVRRGFAIGMTTTGTGLGSIFMPLVISVLLQEFGVTGCMLIIGALSTHTFVASALLQPVKWHMKLVIDPELSEKLVGTDGNENFVHNSNRGLNKTSNMYDSTFSINYDGETISLYGFETPNPRRKMSTVSTISKDKLRARKFSRSISKQESIEEGPNRFSNVSLPKNNPDKTEDSEPAPEPNWFKSFLSFLDVNLLKDPKYVNLMIGMSLAICAEMNFSLLTPFILEDLGYSTYETAQVLSVVAFTDVIFRFLTPFVSHCVKQPIKVMYSISLVMLILSRTALIFVRNYTDLIAVAVFLGIAKGFRTVYMSLLIPCYVPLEKLPNASGMQMVANGLIIMLAGPLVGLIRDLTGSYNKSIIVINLITFSTVSMWTIEAIYYKLIKRDG